MSDCKARSTRNFENLVSQQSDLVTLWFWSAVVGIEARVIRFATDFNPVGAVNASVVFCGGAERKSTRDFYPSASLHKNSRNRGVVF